jgi:hypothetical protein
MKTTLVFSVIALLCTTTPTIQATSKTIQEEVWIPDNNTTAMLIGAGTIRQKSGNNYTILSDDENTYQAVSEVSYVVGAYVSHSDPVNGWVEILGPGD